MSVAVTVNGHAQDLIIDGQKSGKLWALNADTGKLAWYYNHAPGETLDLDEVFERVLVDDHDLPWEKAWAICQATFGYTNHTLLPEALERWSVELFERVLPRHLEIIYEVNRRFLDEVKGRGVDPGAVSRMSLIEEGPVRQVRMAHLAVVGSHSVNGVAALHTDLLKAELFRDFHQLWPDRLNNKTNGVTPRRWLLQANPELARVLTECLGPGWETDIDELKRLESLAEDEPFRRQFRAVKRANKERLAEIIRRECGITVDPDSLFDVQVKRIHEYKRQLLNVLHIIAQYLRIKADPGYSPVARTYVFGGKAAPGYQMAKWTIKRIAPAWARSRRDLDDTYGPDYFEWRRHLYRFLSRVSLKLPVEEGTRRFLQPAVTTNDETFASLGECFTGHLIAQVADSPEIPQTALELLSVITQRVLAYQDWHHAGHGGHSEQDFVDIVKHLFFADLGYAGGAVRFANRNWAEVGAVIPFDLQDDVAVPDDHRAERPIVRGQQHNFVNDHWRNVDMLVGANLPCHFTGRRLQRIQPVTSLALSIGFAIVFYAHQEFIAGQHRPAGNPAFRRINPASFAAQSIHRIQFVAPAAQIDRLGADDRTVIQPLGFFVINRSHPQPCAIDHRISSGLGSASRYHQRLIKQCRRFRRPGQPRHRPALLPRR